MRGTIWKNANEGMRMDKLLKIGTGIFGVLAVLACLSTVGIVGYALVDGTPEKSPEEVYQAEMQAYNEETQDIHVLNEATPSSSGIQTPLYDEHIHNYVESMDVKANCYREGRLKYTCDTCGDIYYIDVPMTGHRPDDEWAVTREATPDLVGLRVKYCIYCDQIVTIEDIPYTSEENSTENENHIHNYTSTIEREPTCIFAGLRKYTCSCGSSYTEPIHAPGHVASDWEVAEEATTTHKGTEQRVCRVCGVLLDSRPIDAKQESPTPTKSPANTVAPTRTPEQTSTPRPNAPTPTNVPTQRPIVTSSPVNTPRPTATPTARPTNTPTARPTNTPTASPTHTPGEKIYGLGDTWKVDGQWELTFDKVTVTEERNNYSGKNPEQVLIIDYTYKNIGYENDILDGLYFSFFTNSQIVDSTGLVGYDYSLNGLNSPKYVPVDASCKAQDSLGLDNKSSEVKIIMSKYDGNEVKQSATFVLPISEETATPTPNATVTPTITPTPPIQPINYSTGAMTFYTYDNNSRYCFIQPITNTGNVPLYLKSCSLDFEDKDGKLLDIEQFVSNCPDVINPGETGYFYNSIGSLMLNESVKNFDSIKAVPHIDVIESDENPVEYEVSDTSLTKNIIGLPSVLGRVTNRTDEDDPLLYLNVIFYDKNGEVIFISGVNVLDLYAGTTKSFECSTIGMPSNIAYGDIANYKVIARKSHYQF